jgi:hypothetical protein
VKKESRRKILLLQNFSKRHFNYKFKHIIFIRLQSHEIITFEEIPTEQKKKKEKKNEETQI